MDTRNGLRQHETRVRVFFFPLNHTNKLVFPPQVRSLSRQKLNNMVSTIKTHRKPCRSARVGDNPVANGTKHDGNDFQSLVNSVRAKTRGKPLERPGNQAFTNFWQIHLQYFPKHTKKIQLNRSFHCRTVQNETYVIISDPKSFNSPEKVKRLPARRK